MMLRILTGILDGLARLLIRRYAPIIVAVTGNAGKTTTKEAIARVLATRYTIRASAGNLNNELGIPTTIIGDVGDEYYRTGGSVRFWLGVILMGVRALVVRAAYPEVLVLEFGADHPGDIGRLASRYRPRVGVITQVGDIPVHVEFFASPRELAAEKAKLISVLGADDTAILGYDDEAVRDMRTTTRAHVRTYGMGEGADVRVSDVELRIHGDAPTGISCNIQLGSNQMPVVIRHTIGVGIARAAAAAIAVGDALGISLSDAVIALSDMKPPAGRMRIIEGIRGTTIIDDTYNASPAAMHIALDAVRQIHAKRRVLVLGDMLELGTFSSTAHRTLGTMAGAIATVLICVGDRAKFIAEAATPLMSADYVHTCANSREAADIVQQLLQSGDLVLVKGSQGMRMERVVLEIMARPELASELLVRQSERWLAK